jgi:SAM-dependent methyltransferase
MRSRERKLRLFVELFQPGPETSVVDVGVTDAPFGGGSSDNFFEALYPWPEQITAVGRTELDRFAAAFPRVRAVRSDGRDLPFADAEFDLGFSNAVVEHVAGGREGQRRFVEELCRVAGRVFVTTPNRYFPLDPHTLLPFAHWLPHGAARDRLLRARGFDDVLDPLGPKELARLFPYPVRVINTGMTLVAVGPS